VNSLLTDSQTEETDPFGLVSVGLRRERESKKEREREKESLLLFFDKLQRNEP
jgi:hypothetical protein